MSRNGMIALHFNERMHVPNIRRLKSTFKIDMSSFINFDFMFKSEPNSDIEPD